MCVCVVVVDIMCIALNFFLRAQTDGILQMLQSDWFQQQAEFSNLAHSQWNPFSVMSQVAISI